MNLQEFLKKNAGQDLSKLVLSISETSNKVRDAIPRGAGLSAGVNPSGDRQKEIDVYSNDAFAKALISTRAAREVASEEMAAPITGRGSVSVAMDPLDGSSNIGTNNPVGSIFGFYSQKLPCSGRSILGALFVTYGSMTTLTMSFGRGVHRFVAVRRGSRYTFELLDSGLRMPETPEVYGFGGQRKDWVEPVRRFVASLEDRGLKLRYCGTFVGDYNQVLARGGIFAYPALKDRPGGKLRVLYETAPMAFITEQAGGYASDGRGSILDIEPNSFHETSPAYLGSAPLTRELEGLLSSR